MALTDEEIKEKVIKHDYEFKLLTKGMSDVVSEMHNLAKVLKETMQEKMVVLEKNLDESFKRVHKRNDEIEDDVEKIQDVCNIHGCPALKSEANRIDTLNRAMFGKDGRGGIIFDVEDIKKFIYKAMGGFTVLNLIFGAIMVYLSK